jgi:hypothetical protein
MKRSIGMMVGQLSRKILILLVAIVLLSPASNAVLCIAPGGHVAIENLNAECCASSVTSTRNDLHPGDGFNRASDCLNCTDILISLNECGPVPELSDGAAGSIADECFGDRLPVNGSFQLLRRSEPAEFGASTPASSSAPLRC